MKDVVADEVGQWSGGEDGDCREKGRGGREEAEGRKKEFISNV